MDDTDLESIPLKKRHNNIPWIEKYRPTQFTDIVLEPHNRRLFENIIEQKTPYFPNLLLYGPPGTGKTTSIINLVSEYQRRNYPNQKNSSSNVIHLNASDERGIDIIRNQINLFIKSQHLFEPGLKFVVLDEVDYMTKSAQQALKYILQTFDYNNVRFFLICNYISKIDESLQREFITIQFNRLPAADVSRFLLKICQNEQIEMTEEKVAKIMSLYNQDVRGMIKFIQLNQENIMNEDVWSHLDDMFFSKDTDTSRIENYIHDVSAMYNMEEKQIVEQYLEYIFNHSSKNRFPITTEFIDFVEIVVHNLGNEVLLPFFVMKMREFSA
jgi:replication factor C subunit 3/5